MIVLNVTFISIVIYSKATPFSIFAIIDNCVPPTRARRPGTGGGGRLPGCSGGGGGESVDCAVAAAGELIPRVDGKADLLSGPEVEARVAEASAATSFSALSSSSTALCASAFSTDRGAGLRAAVGNEDAWCYAHRARMPYPLFTSTLKRCGCSSTAII